MSSACYIISTLHILLSLVSSLASYDSNIKVHVSVEVPYRENQIFNYEKQTTEFPNENLECTISSSLKEEIKSYQPVVDKIIDAITNGQFKGKVYEELAFFVDKFGSRFTGTKNLEDSIDYMIRLLLQHDLEDVHGEKVNVPHWIRGEEKAVMILPRVYKFGVLGLGGTVGTPPDGITAEVLVVNSFDELHQKAHMAKGKIIVFNEDWVTYGDSVKYRSKGAVEAAKVGGVASLIRSVTPFSLYTLHTGAQSYNDNITKIPTASITVEDAELFQRLSDRGEKIVIKLFMQSEMKPNTVSRNVVAEIVGNNKEKEIVLVSGHIDSWDVGQGAMDDGAGAFVSWYSLAVLKGLGLRPQRTVRAILWTAEEPGLIGVQQYVQAHAKELNDFNLVMESDEGTFTPEGIEFSGTKDAGCILQEIAKLMKPLNATNFKMEKYVGSDITYFIQNGVPAADLINKNEKYFYYHHTNADTMTVLNSDDLDRNVAMFAAISYVVSDISIKLPREHIPSSTINVSRGSKYESDRIPEEKGSSPKNFNIEEEKLLRLQNEVTHIDQFN